MKTAILLLLSVTLVRDLGQWENAPPEQREWAQAQLVPGGPEVGKSCCNDADSSQVLEDIRSDGHYWIVFDALGIRVGPVAVPPELVLQRSSFGPKVWWYNSSGQIKIRCYAPGPGI